MDSSVICFKWINTGLTYHGRRRGSSCDTRSDTLCIDGYKKYAQEEELKLHFDCFYAVK